MRIEEIAYYRGFRVSKKGELYNLNGRNYKASVKNKKWSFSINTGSKVITVYVCRLQAFQVFESKLYEFKSIRFRDLDTLNCSRDNILLGKGSEIITQNLKKLRREELAIELGWKVLKDGSLIKGGTLRKGHLNNNGYRCFSIPFEQNKMKIVLLHRLAAFQLFGKRLYENPLVRHLDGNHLNNSFNNLDLGDYNDNFNDIPDEINKDRYIRSMQTRKRMQGTVRDNVRNDKKNMTYDQLSKKYSISLSTVYRITKLETV